MSSGVLQFTLGMAAGGFVSGIGQANSALTGFLGSMVSLGAVTAGVMGAIEKGAALEHLHKRTGESVADLYKLEKGFTAAGLSADDVGGALFHMQKSLGGVNEMGESTADIFKRLGLDVGKLKTQGGAEALKEITNSLGRLNQSDAASAASSIFGRQQAGNMIQLARSTEEFAGGMKSAATNAATFQRNAAAFAHLEITLDKIHGKTKSLFLGIAEGVGPAITNIVDMLNQIDLSGVGLQIGNFLTALTQAFREGTFTELIATSISTGFEIGVASLPAILEKIGVMLLNIFKTPLNYLQAGLTFMTEKAGELIEKLLAKLHLPGHAFGTEGYQARSFGEVLKDQEKDGPQFFEQGNGLGELGADADKRMQDAKEKIKGISAPLMNMIDGLVSRAPKGEGDKSIGRGLNASLGSAKESKPDANMLEKMGFVMGNGHSSTDHARKTSDNTKKTSDLLVITNKHLATLVTAGGSGGSFANV